MSSRIALFTFIEQVIFIDWKKSSIILRFEPWILDDICAEACAWIQASNNEILFWSARKLFQFWKIFKFSYLCYNVMLQNRKFWIYMLIIILRKCEFNYLITFNSKILGYFYLSKCSSSSIAQSEWFKIWKKEILLSNISNRSN